MKKRLILSLIAVAGIAAACGQQRGAGRQAAGDGGPVFLDETRTIEERVEDALARMTTEEKVAVLHAQSKFSSAGVPRLARASRWEEQAMQAGPFSSAGWIRYCLKNRRRMSCPISRPNV